MNYTKKNASLILIFNLFTSISLEGASKIVISIQRYHALSTHPENTPKKTPGQKLQEILTSPGKGTETIFNHNYLSSRTNEGIFVAYGGRMGVTDQNGYITFTKRHLKRSIYLLITPRIVPIAMYGKVIHHWEIDPHMPAQMYSADFQQDKLTGLYYWQVTTTQLPKNNRIDLPTVIIFADPKNIYVPEGATIAPKTGHLIVPPIYAKKELNVVKRALGVLKFRLFFKPIITQDTQQNNTYYSRMPQN